MGNQGLVVTRVEKGFENCAVVQVDALLSVVSEAQLDLLLGLSLDQGDLGFS
jgi:hypothetical protein